MGSTLLIGALLRVYLVERNKLGVFQAPHCDLSASDYILLVGSVLPLESRVIFMTNRSVVY